jgi:hypothetical protein
MQSSSAALCTFVGHHQKINACNRTDIQVYFGDATAYAAHVAIRRNGEKTQ